MEENKKKFTLNNNQNLIVKNNLLMSSFYNLQILNIIGAYNRKTYNTNAKECITDADIKKIYDDVEKELNTNDKTMQLSMFFKNHKYPSDKELSELFNKKIKENGFNIPKNLFDENSFSNKSKKYSDFKNLIAQYKRIPLTSLFGDFEGSNLPVSSDIYSYSTDFFNNIINNIDRSDLKVGNLKDIVNRIYATNNNIANNNPVIIYENKQNGYSLPENINNKFYQKKLSNTTIADFDSITGLSKLKKYLTLKEYNNLKTNIIKSSVFDGCFDANGNIIKTLPIHSPNEQQAIENICEIIRKNGLPFTVNFDTNGIIDLNIKRGRAGNVSVRVFDLTNKVNNTNKKENISQIGKVLADGLVSRLAISSFSTTENEIKQFIENVKPEAYTYPLQMLLNGNVAKNYLQAYQTKDNKGCSSVIGKYNNINLLLNTSVNYKNKSYFLENSEMAFDFIDTRFRLAKTNMKKLINGENLYDVIKQIDTAKLFDKDYDELIDNLHENKDIRMIQKELLDLVIEHKKFELNGKEYYAHIMDNVQLNEFIDDRITNVLGVIDDSTIKFDVAKTIMFNRTSKNINEESDMFSEAIRTLNLNKENFIVDNESDSLSTFTQVYRKSIDFNEKTAIPMNTANDFFKDRLKVIVQSLADSGNKVDENNIYIDENGVVLIKDIKKNVGTKNSEERTFDFQLGQIFENKDGLVTAKYRDEEEKNYFVGYTATIDNSPDNFEKFTDRFTLTGYNDVLDEYIRRCIRENTSVVDFKGEGKTTIYDNAGLQTAIIHSYKEQVKGDLNLERNKNLRAIVTKTVSINKEEMDKAKKRLEKEKNYENDLKNIGESYYSINIFNPAETAEIEKNNDNGYCTIQLQKNTDNISHLCGYVTGQGANQGRMMVINAGTIVKNGKLVFDENAEFFANVPEFMISQEIKKNPDSKHYIFDTCDRQAMAMSNLKQSITTAEELSMLKLSEMHENNEISDEEFSHKLNSYGKPLTAYINLPDNHEDACIITLNLAKKRGIVDEETGEIRNLCVGDKLCDLHGNKSIISRIIDTNISEQEARDKGVYEEWKIFTDNKNLNKYGDSLELLVSPYSPLSRQNAGTCIDGINSFQKYNLNLPNGQVVKDSIIHQKYISVADAKEKCTVYAKTPDEELSKDYKLNYNGRKVGGQATLAFYSKENGKEILKNLYKNNDGLEDFIKTMSSCGYSFNKKTALFSNGINYDKNMSCLNLADITMPKSENGVAQKYESKNGEISNFIFDDEYFENCFNDAMNDELSFMILPFELELASGIKTPELIYKDGNLKIKSNEDISSENEKMYALPILPKKLRVVNRTDDDLGIMNSDMAQYYSKIAKQINSYVKTKKNTEDYLSISNNEEINNKKRNNLNNKLDNTKKDVQAIYDKIIFELEKEKLNPNSKYNIVRDGIYQNKIKIGSNLVLTPDSNLALNEIRIHSNLAKHYNLQKDENGDIWCVIERDPVIDDKAFNLVKVTISDDETYQSKYNIATNPIMPKIMGGDFDGDKLYNTNPSQLSIKSDNDAFKIQNQIFNDLVISTKDGIKTALETGGYYDGILNQDSELKKEYTNALQNLYDNRTEENLKIFSDVVDRVSHYPIDKKNYHILSFTDKDSVMKSLGIIVNSGAKGNQESLTKFGEILNNGHSIEDSINSGKAQSIKNNYTGTVNMLFTKLYRFTRDNSKAMKYITSIDAHLTNELMGIKKNASKGELLITRINTLKKIFEGKLVKRNNEDIWEVVRNVDKDGKEVMPFSADWAYSTSNYLENELGLKNINMSDFNELVECISENGVMIDQTKHRNLSTNTDILAYGMSGGNKSMLKLVNEMAAGNIKLYNDENVFISNELRKEYLQGQQNEKDISNKDKEIIFTTYKPTDYSKEFREKVAQINGTEVDEKDNEYIA